MADSGSIVSDCVEIQAPPIVRWFEGGLESQSFIGIRLRRFLEGWRCLQNCHNLDLESFSGFAIGSLAPRFYPLFAG
jgi:hypothetical protein